jgi:hypothetical protein
MWDVYPLSDVRSFVCHWHYHVLWPESENVDRIPSHIYQYQWSMYLTEGVKYRPEGQINFDTLYTRLITLSDYFLKMSSR